MNRRTFLVFSAVLICSAAIPRSPLQAATKIQGKVLQETTESPLSGGVVTLIQDETENIVFTRPDGTFELLVEDAESTEILKKGRIEVKTHEGKIIRVKDLEEQVASKLHSIDDDADQIVFLSEIYF